MHLIFKFMLQSRQWSDMIRTKLNVAAKNLWTVFEYNHKFVLEQANLGGPQIIYFPSKKLLKLKCSFWKLV